MHIALFGKRQSGKTTAYHFLKNIVSVQDNVTCMRDLLNRGDETLLVEIRRPGFNEEDHVLHQVLQPKVIIYNNGSLDDLKLKLIQELLI